MTSHEPTPSAPYGGVTVQPVGDKKKRPVIVWDLVLTLILLLPMLATVVTTMFISPFLVMASDPCGGAIQCNDSLMGAGILLCFIGPIIIFVLAAALTIVLLILRRVAFWVPLVGIVLMVGVFIFGMMMVTWGVPGSSL